MPKVWNGKAWIRKLFKVGTASTAILGAIGWLFNWHVWADQSIRANASNIAHNRELDDEWHREIKDQMNHIQGTTDKLLDIQLQERHRNGP